MMRKKLADTEIKAPFTASVQKADGFRSANMLRRANRFTN